MILWHKVPPYQVLFTLPWCFIFKIFWDQSHFRIFCYNHFLPQGSNKLEYYRKVPRCTQYLMLLWHKVPPYFRPFPCPNTPSTLCYCGIRSPPNYPLGLLMNWMHDSNTIVVLYLPIKFEILICDAGHHLDLMQWTWVTVSVVFEWGSREDITQYFITQLFKVLWYCKFAFIFGLKIDGLPTVLYTRVA